MSPRNLHNVLLKRHFSNCWKTKLHETNPSAFYYHRFYSSEQRTVSESILSIWEALLDEWHSFSPKPATTSCVTLRKKKILLKPNTHRMHFTFRVIQLLQCCVVQYYMMFIQPKKWMDRNQQNEDGMSHGRLIYW